MSARCLSLSLLILVLGIMTFVDANADSSTTPRESVLDRVVHISSAWLPVPEVKPLCDGLTGLTKIAIAVDDGNLYCEIQGDGTPLVLLNGGPGCSHQIFHPHFSRAASFAQVIYYDQRGVGQSSQDATGKTYSLKQATDDLDRLRAELGVERWVVLGHSYGGLLAQCYALEYPDRVMGLVLVCSSTGSNNIETGQTRQYDFMTPEEREKIRACFGMKDATPEERLYNAHWNGDWKRQDYCRPTDEELARTALYIWTPAPGFRERIGQDIGMIDLKGMFADFEIPTMLFESKWDLTWGDVKKQNFRQNHPSAEMIIFEKSGHSPYMDEPERFFQALEDFVVRANQTPKPAKLPSKRIDWPLPIIQEILALPYTGTNEQAKPLFEKAKQEDIKNPIIWFKLGMLLYDGGAYAEALESFERAITFPEFDGIYRFTCFVWQGHILDLQGKRDEAIARYKKALEVGISPTDTMQHSQYNMILNRAWVEERLKTPFTREK